MKQRDDPAPNPAVKALAEDLLGSARLDLPPAGAMRRTAGVLGVSAAALARGTRAMAAASSAAAPVAGSSAAAVHGAGIKVLLLAKWATGGLVLGAVAMTGVEWTRLSYAPPQVSERRAESSARPESGPNDVGLAQAAPAEAQSPARPATSRAFIEGTLSQPQRAKQEDTSRQPGLAPPAIGQEERPIASAAAAFQVWPEPASAAATAPPAHPLALERKDPLAGEVKRLDAARGELASGQMQAALSTLGRYHAEYPAGVLRAEALALTVDAWRNAGNPAEAERWLDRLRWSFPKSPHLERLSPSKPTPAR